MYPGLFLFINFFVCFDALQIICEDTSAECDWVIEKKLCGALEDMCRKSCGQCEVCEDTSSQCDWVVAHEMCGAIDDMCRKSCGQCEDGTTIEAPACPACPVAPTCPAVPICPDAPPPCPVTTTPLPIDTDLDDELCPLFDKEDCRKESVNKRCPQFCSKGVCIPQCINGFCADDNVCACIDGWTGDICEIAVCTPQCINGNCSDDHVCVCSDGWSGETCEIGSCSESDGFFKAPGSDQCYKALYRKGNNRAGADRLCKDEGLALAEPKNPIELRKLLNTKYGGKNCTWWWTGGVGTGSSLQFPRGGEHIYPGDSLWLPPYPLHHNGGIHIGTCLAMDGCEGNLSRYPTAPYFSIHCNGGSWLCEVVTE